MYRKVCSLFLALIMTCGLAVNAAASEAPVDSEDEPNTTENEAGTNATLIAHPTNAYLYWTTQMLDTNPSIHYDASMEQYYLVFGLSTSSKLALLIDNYRSAFKLERNLAYLRQINDLSTAIWDKDATLYPQTIGERLSEDTAAKVGPDSDLDAYEALMMIQQSPEYADDELFKVQVNYSLSCITSIAKELADGMRQITEFSRVPSTAVYGLSVSSNYSEMTPSELCGTVQQFLDEHSDWNVMSKTYEMVMSGATSNYLATFEELDQDELADFYRQVANTATRYWPYAIEALDAQCFAVPFPFGTVFEWSDDVRNTANLIENNVFPVSVTAG